MVDFVSSFVHSLVNRHSFNKLLLSNYHVPGGGETAFEARALLS